MDNHKYVITSFGKETSDDELDYLIQNPYKQHYIASSCKCCVKHLAILLQNGSNIKLGPKKNCKTTFSTIIKV